ncbi:hypothetical protein PV689_04615 [Streptomyces sp. ATCC51928]|uniref:Uncharacterized protein n=1 Tax=Streptomyces caviscabies TaxID=90079 RepID=A0ABW2M4E0_9ACTN|nr:MULTISPECIES: hypothetical protein [unclassified Streptomyces]MDX3501189.1 hypothetical protein [Streptomyces sp. ATCC51928]MDX5521693.1 hypothetical protein [Streptomyces sp. DE06-01C]
MSGENADLNVPPAALAQIAKGIGLAHAELKELGMIGKASAGRGFSDLALSGLELGHSGLASQFETFCKRWEWGVRALTQRGNSFALGVGLSAGSFAEQERYIKDSFKIAMNSTNGNPYLSEDEVKGMSWDSISKQHAWDNPDWSADSFTEAHDEVKQQWKDTGYDVGDALLDASGVDAEQREGIDAWAEEHLDPSEETVAQAEEPRWGQNR